MTSPASLPASPLPPRVALVVGGVGTVLAAVAAFVPSPWGGLVAVVGFLAAGLAGLAVRPPALTAGRPLLQGGALIAASGALTALVEFFQFIPQGWPASVALAVGSLLAWLTGRAMPQLGAGAVEAPAAPPQAPAADLPAAASTFERGPNP